MKFSHRARAWLAYIRSFFKKNWQLCDYPIHYMPQTHTGPDTPERLRVLPWRADILAGISQAWETLEKRHTPILNQNSPPHEKIEPSCLDLVDRFPSRSHQPKEFPSIPISAITLSKKVLAHEWAISLRRILSLGLSRRNGQHRVDPQDRRSVRSRRFRTSARPILWKSSKRLPIKSDNFPRIQS
jgi:hypothetical protein